MVLSLIVGEENEMIGAHFKQRDWGLCLDGFIVKPFKLNYWIQIKVVINNPTLAALLHAASFSAYIGYKNVSKSQFWVAKAK